MSLPVLVGAGLLTILGWFAAAVNGGVGFLGYGLLACGGFLLLSPLTLAVHEMGHAAVAVLLGRRVYQINIGSGRPFRSFEIQHTLLVFGRDLGSGFVRQVPLKKASRRGDAAFIAAGATANFIVAAALVFWADRLSAWSGAAAAVVAGSILSNLSTGFGALIPKNHIIDGLSLASDGRQLLQLLRRPRAVVDWQVHHDTFRGGQLLRAKRWQEAEAHYRDAFLRHPDHPGFLGLLMHVLSVSKGNEAARSCVDEHDAFLRQEGQIAGPMAPLWSYAWSMAAWTIIQSPTGDVTWAEMLLRKALQADPSPYVGAVQGAIFIRAGERRRGLSEILVNLRELGSPGDKLEFCDFIIAEQLENTDPRASDLQSYAAHLRALA